MFQNRYSSCFSSFIFAIFFSFFLIPLSYSQNDPKVAEGAALFKEAGCNTCHAVHKKVVGPALKDVSKRWKNQQELIAFIRNSAKLIASGHPYSNQIFKEYNGLQMPNHEFLTEDQVKSILAYIKAEEANVPQEKKDPTPDQAGGGQTTPGKDSSGMILTLILVVLALVLLTLVLLLVFIRRYLKDKEVSLREDEKALVNQKYDIAGFFKSKGFIGVVVLIFVLVGSRSCYIGLLSVGVEQNYMPAQPIPFSHKLHAGQYKINCNYCHTGVTKSKNANIPSINICMNCHSEIKEGPKHGKAGIALLLEHYEKQKPIEWVRVHNLPDLAYFNHSQHVQVGGIECQTCHGQIDTMEVVRQHSPLTMGWCINCHRETKVNGKDNAYYDKLYAKHKEMTVENIGGLECSKCHY
jgi:cytochrome c551/c552/preprotein translocase subunit SecG